MSVIIAADFLQVTGSRIERKNYHGKENLGFSVPLEADTILFPMAHEPLVGQGLIIIERSQSHSDTQHSLGLLWMRDRPDTETST